MFSSLPRPSDEQINAALPENYSHHFTVIPTDLQTQNLSEMEQTLCNLYVSGLGAAFSKAERGSFTCDPVDGQVEISFTLRQPPNWFGDVPWSMRRDAEPRVTAGVIMQQDGRRCVVYDAEGEEYLRSGGTADTVGFIALLEQEGQSDERQTVRVKRFAKCLRTEDFEGYDVLSLVPTSIVDGEKKWEVQAAIDSLGKGTYSSISANVEKCELDSMNPSASKVRIRINDGCIAGLGAWSAQQSCGVGERQPRTIRIPGHVMVSDKSNPGVITLWDDEFATSLQGMDGKSSGDTVSEGARSTGKVLQLIRSSGFSHQGGDEQWMATCYP